MTLGMIQFPGPGCIVEFMQGNAPQIAWVLEEQGGRLRLLLPNRRETTLQSNRLLPWSGPAHNVVASRDAAVEQLNTHRDLREQRAAQLDMIELWTIAQGEVDRASADWFAELAASTPDIDTVAAYGHALLACKTHFKFQPPDFEIFPESVVQKRLDEQENTRRREELARQGIAWFAILWEVHSKKRPVLPPEVLSEDVATRLKSLLMRRIADPDASIADADDDAQWRLLTKGLPDEAQLALYLAQAWGLVPPHYNYWMDRAGYQPGNAWAETFADATRQLIEQAAHADLPERDTPFVSVDSATTQDIDDAFFVRALPEGGWHLELALACPALDWPFGSPLDKAVLHRATSLYLPEATHHMLPEALGMQAYALTADGPRPAFVVTCAIASDGTVTRCEPSLARIRIRANLTYDAVEATLHGDDSPAAPFADSLHAAHALAVLRQQGRLARGAVIIERPDPQFILEPGAHPADIVVRLEDTPEVPDAHLVVSELMILANAELARWAATHGLTLLHRTQDVAVPREYVGIWSAPHDVARVVRALAPASLETTPRPHAGLGEEAYAPSTSPLRRYPDLINEAQCVHMLRHGLPRWSKEELDALLPFINARLEAAGQVQRLRPRYWKLLYIRQQGDKHWWPAAITDENDAFVSVSLPREQLFLRARHNLFGERIQPGQAVEVRLNKVHPLNNEVQIAEAREPA